MSRSTSRRSFLKSTGAVGSVWGLADVGFLKHLPTVSAAEAVPDPKRVLLSEDIEPLVRLLEDTPRDQLMEKVAARIHGGATYREILAALLLAGVRNVQPRPVGFKFHAVLVVNSAHLASLASPDEHRWLPIFWALDYFKDAQAQNASQGDWHLGPVDEAAVPHADKAHAAFVAAMDQWDEKGVDAAVTGLARHAGINETYELLFRYGCRDFRDIGHKAIYAANSFRTLQTIGWQYAEPVLRSLAYAMLQHEGENPAQRDAPADRPGRRNLELAKKFRADWTSGRRDSGATHDLLMTLRSGDENAACDKVVELIERKIAPQSIWDAFHVAGGELLARQPGIVGIHTVTSTNALHYAFQTAASDDHRRLLLLQNAAFLPMFRAAMQGRGALKDFKLDELEPADVQASGADAITEIMSDISSDRTLAAKKILGYARKNPAPQSLFDAARVLVFFKGRDAHDYKFSSALLEDYRNVSPGWRERYLAAGVFNLKGAAAPDNALVPRIQAALKA
ncbi:MAG TPA: hypothetical protein VFE24_03210 [Pirellulales bacterium]|jgi:hypothetical protein|nr:hypothetical protein [Pirellulales bacterium]